MKHITFIQNLVTEQKITLCESSVNIFDSYNKKSENSLKAAKLLEEQNLLEEATSMSYYSMYHKVNALFRLIGIKCENHSAIIILLKELFNLDNSQISYAKTERIDKQYYTDFTITKKAVNAMLKNTEDFIEKIDLFVDNLGEKEIKFYYNEFQKIYF